MQGRAYKQKQQVREILIALLIIGGLVIWGFAASRAQNWRGVVPDSYSVLVQCAIAVLLFFAPRLVTPGGPNTYRWYEWSTQCTLLVVALGTTTGWLMLRLPEHAFKGFITQLILQGVFIMDVLIALWLIKTACLFFQGIQEGDLAQRLEGWTFLQQWLTGGRIPASRRRPQRRY